jgi:hypothetical protein
MEYTEEELIEVVQRWEHTGLLSNLPLYEKQELAPLFDNATRVFLSKNLDEITNDLVETVLYPICRRLYRRVGLDFNIENMVDSLIKKVKEDKEILLKNNIDSRVNSVVVFSVNFADIYEDETTNKKQFDDDEYLDRVNKLLNTMKEILINKEMVSFVDRTQDNWEVITSDGKKSDKQIRHWNQKIAREVFETILKDTNKGI